MKLLLGMYLLGGVVVWLVVVSFIQTGSVREAEEAKGARGLVCAFGGQIYYSESQGKIAEFDCR